MINHPFPHVIFIPLSLPSLHSYQKTVYKSRGFRRVVTNFSSDKQLQLQSNFLNQVLQHPPTNNTNQSTMASVPPGDITTMPSQKVIFNAPFDDKHTYFMKILNSGGHRIGFAFKTTNGQRLNMDPPNGVLDPKESINIAISCDAIDTSTEATNNDRVTVEWTNTPEGAAKQFRREWFQGDGMVRRKNLPIEYNM